MKLFEILSLLIVLATIFAYVNHRFIKLPSAIGLMLLAFITSILLILMGLVYPPALNQLSSILTTLDFSELVMGSMLSFLLFAGAIHVKLDELKKVWLSVTLFSTIGVVIASLVIGSVFYLLLPYFGIQMPFFYCLLFGSLIAPTDPIGVLGVLKKANTPKSLEIKITGESLFNDGVGVVVFLTILEIVNKPIMPTWFEITTLFAQEAVGGIILGLVLGYVGNKLMKSIDNYTVEVMITLAIVMGGYSFAHYLHVSGPLAMVVAGLMVGNHGKEFAMSSTTEEYVDKFWEMIDEILNAMLFVLIGLELLVIKFTPIYFLIGLVAIIVVISTRYLSLFVPAQLIRFREKTSQKTMLLLVWGGLRGGISIALALSLKPEFGKDLWLALTYFVVAFSILVQGLTIGKLAKKFED